MALAEIPSPSMPEQFTDVGGIPVFGVVRHLFAEGEPSEPEVAHGPCHRDVVPAPRDKTLGSFLVDLESN